MDPACDLVILGAGLAGLTAGNRARQLGLTVAIVEQGDGPQYPCNSRFSGGILHLAFQNVKDDPERILQAMRDANGGYGDPAVLGQLAHTSARAVDWLAEEGARFIRVGQIVWQQWMFAPPRPLTPGLDWNGRGPDVTLRKLLDNYLSRGGRLFQRARGLELVQQDGVCRGLEVDADGERVTLEAGAVLIADGGFQANLELLRSISPAPDRLLQRGAANARGAGLQMAQALGAGVSDLSTFYGHLLARDALDNPRLWPYPQLDELATSGIVVTTRGERFTDEGLGGVNLANRIARREDPLDCFVVFDSAIWETAGKGARIPANPHLIEGGAKLIAADTIDALGAAMGVPAGRLRQSVDDYNQAVQSGATEVLMPPRSRTKYSPMPIAHAPFHALPACAGITHTTGGLLIDEHARVRRKDGGIIPGLYAAGSSTGGIEGGPNIGYIGGLMKALVFGLVAAEDVAVRKGAAALAAAIPAAPKDAHSVAPKEARSVAPKEAHSIAPKEARPAVSQDAYPGAPKNAYPALSWLVRHGRGLSIALSLAPLLGAAALLLSGHWLWAIVAACTAPVVFLLVKSYVELVRLMSDMLIPK